LEFENRNLTGAFHALIRGERTGAWAALQRAGLWSLSLGYGLAVRVRNLAFERGWKTIHKAGVPVVSIGNLTAGGTGKTPCVEWVARCLRRLDQRVVVLSRGYGSEAGRNDEALVLEENLPDVPHLQGADRAELAQAAQSELDCEIIVLDDGFQHRQLHRDLDIVLIDATCPWGHGYLLPRGLLREPIAGLRRAHLAILTRCDLSDAAALAEIRAKVRRINPDIPVLESIHQPASWWNGSGREVALDTLKDRPIAGFCGLGNPEAFRQTLLKLGMNLVAWRTYPDHHAYQRADVEALGAWARELPPGAILATTQKDLVKLGLDRLGDRELWALHIQLHITSGQETLEAMLRKTCTTAPIP
jgi:tetraacyldisaccharide 4'-kinase